jgi:hypothetical protein
MDIMILPKLQERKVLKPRIMAMALAVSLIMAFICSCSSGEKPLLLDQEHVKNRLNNSEVIIIDVRAAKDWNVSDKKIQGALRQDPNEVTTWVNNLPKNKEIVIY